MVTLFGLVQYGVRGLGFMPNLLRTLAYVSRATEPLDINALRDLSNRAQAFNDTVDVTGILVYADGFFVQTIEGVGRALEAVFARIESDVRHSIINVYMRGAIERRLYPAWAMITDPSRETPILKSFLEARRAGLEDTFTGEQADSLNKTLQFVEAGRGAPWLASYGDAKSA